MPERRRQERSFDPKGEGYFDAIAEILRKRSSPLGEKPLLPPMPWGESERVGFQPPWKNESFDAWVWHPGEVPFREEPGWVVHSPSVTGEIDLLDALLETGTADAARKAAAERLGAEDDDWLNEVLLVLKGTGHPTYDKGVKAEEDRGSFVIEGPEGLQLSVQRRRR